MLAKLVGNKVNNNGAFPKIHVPGSNAAAIITLAAVAGQRNIVEAIQWSYSAAPTNGRLTVVDGVTTVLDIDITAAGPGGFGLTIPGSVNSAVVITLAAGGSLIGKLNAQVTLEPD